MPSRPSTTRPTQHHPTTDRRRRTNASQTNRIRPQTQHHPGIKLPQLPRPAARHICSRYPHRPPHQALHHPPCTQRRRPHHHPRRPPYHSRPQHRRSLQHVRRIRLSCHRPHSPHRLLARRHLHRLRHALAHSQNDQPHLHRPGPHPRRSHRQRLRPHPLPLRHRLHRDPHHPLPLARLQRSRQLHRHRSMPPPHRNIPPPTHNLP